MIFFGRVHQAVSSSTGFCWGEGSFLLRRADVCQKLLNTALPRYRWVLVCLFWCACFLPFSILQTGPLGLLEWGRAGYLEGRGHMTGPRGAELVALTILQQTHHFAVLPSPSLSAQLQTWQRARCNPPPHPSPKPHLQLLVCSFWRLAHKGNVDVYVPCANMTVFRPVAPVCVLVCSFYTLVLWFIVWVVVRVVL